MAATKNIFTILVPPDPGDTRTTDWDLRKHVKVGDRITYGSTFRCGGADELQRRDLIPNNAVVTAVNRDFCMVQLKRVVEGVNRWDIYKINGADVDFGLEKRSRGRN